MRYSGFLLHMGKHSTWMMGAQAGRPWESELFGYNYPLPNYIEPEGYTELCRYTNTTLALYERLVPRTFAAANALFDSIGEKRVWGMQIGEGAWITETAKKRVTIKKGSTATRPCRPLQLIDICKHLCGRGFARGSTDMIPQAEGRETPLYWDQALVQYLRFDIDQTSEWQFGNEEVIWNTLDRSPGSWLPSAGLIGFSRRAPEESR